MIEQEAYNIVINNKKGRQPTKKEIFAENKHENIYFIDICTKLKRPFYISKKFGLKIRNLNKLEIFSLKSCLNYELERLFSVDKSDLTLLENKVTSENAMDIYNEYWSSFLSNVKNKKTDSANYDQDYLDKIMHIKELKDIIKLCDSKINIKTNITSGNDKYDKYILADAYSTVFTEEIVVLEIENVEYIENCLKLYNNIDDTSNLEDEVLRELKNDFLEDIVYFYNMISFKQEGRLGIRYRPFERDFKNIFQCIHGYKYEEEFMEENYLEEFLFAKNQKPFIDYFVCNEEKVLDFLFILETLKIGKYSNKQKILSYVTLLEFLLTHKPDTNRYNVEESIVKQFVGNIITCLSLENNIKTEEEFNLISQELKIIYDYRSNILHGNWSLLDKNIRKLKEFPFFKEKYQKLREWKIDKYGTDNQNVEDILEERLRKILVTIFKIISNKPILLRSLKK